jgi:predicted dehydrogenase
MPKSDTVGSRKTLDVVIIGCGMIAGGHDESRQGDEILSHAGAYSCHPGYRIRACIDPNRERRRRFKERWGVEKAFADLDQCLADGLSFDVASVAAPTAAHAAILRRLLETPVKAVFCEKPLTGDAAETRRIVKSYAAARLPLAVNYFRRYDSAIQRLKREIDEGTWGALQWACGFYGKGILHNGSHMVHLMQYLFGTLKPLAVLRARTDYEAADPTLDAILATGAEAPIHLIGSDSRHYNVFEACLAFERGQIVLEEGMRVVRVRPVSDDPLYPGHRHLGRGRRRKGAQGRALLRAVDDLYRSVTGGAPLASGGDAALAAEEVCSRMQEMARASRVTRVP